MLTHWCCRYLKATMQATVYKVFEILPEEKKVVRIYKACAMPRTHVGYPMGISWGPYICVSIIYIYIYIYIYRPAGRDCGRWSSDFYIYIYGSGAPRLNMRKERLDDRCFSQGGFHASHPAGLLVTHTCLYQGQWAQALREGQVKTNRLRSFSSSSRW